MQIRGSVNSHYESHNPASMCILGDSPSRQNVREVVRDKMINKGREKVFGYECV